MSSVFNPSRHHDRSRRDLPSGWRMVSLGEVCQHNLGKMLDQQKNKGTPRPYLRNPNVQWFDFRLDDLQTMPFEDHELHKYVVQPGDVVVCEGGEAGRAAIWDGRLDEIYIQKALHRVRVGPNLLNRYLVYQLMTDAKRGRLGEYFTGTTIPHFTGQDLDRYTFPLPPLPEQKRIVAILDKAAAIRRKRLEASRISDDLVPSLFRDIFGKYLRTPAVDMPRLGDPELSDIASGVTKGRRFNGQHTVIVPYIRVANVQDGFLNLTEVKTIEVLPADVEALRLQHGDVLMTEGGDFDKLGRGAMWEADIPDCIHQNHVFRVRCNRRNLLPVYLANYIRTEVARAYFLRCAKKTSNLASMNMTQLRATPVACPPLKLQERFAADVQSVYALRAKQSAASRESEAVFHALVDRAFRGEL